jgi:hypothetical protein
MTECITITAHLTYFLSHLLSYIDSREVLPNIIYAYRIAKALGCTMEYLVTGVKKPACANCDFGKLMKNLEKLDYKELHLVSDLVNTITKNKEETEHLPL